MSSEEHTVIELQLKLSELQERNNQLTSRVRELNQRNEQALETYEKRRQLLKKSVPNHEESGYTTQKIKNQTTSKVGE